MKVQSENKRVMNAETQALVESEFDTAMKMAQRLLRRWNAYLNVRELRSVVGVALVDAALLYDSSKGTKFTTYLFYFLKSALLTEISFFANKSRSRSGRHVEEVITENLELAQSLSTEEDDSRFESPEKQVYYAEFRNAYRNAVRDLKPLEQSVLENVVVHGDKVARVARRMGYSRGHISEIRTLALRKIRARCEHFKEAA